jgi:tRNA modification GTPase
MNAIVGREASIVSEEAGTTRDVVEVNLDMGGFLCSFADTAGIRTGGEETNPIGNVEQEGMRRARVTAAEADVVVVMASVERQRQKECPQIQGQEVQGRHKCQEGLQEYQGQHGWKICYDDETLTLASRAKKALTVINKCESVEVPALKELVHSWQKHMSASHPTLAALEPLVISCREADKSSSSSQVRSQSTARQAFSPNDPGGIRALTAALTTHFAAITDVAEDEQDLLGVTERQRQLLSECRYHLNGFMAEAARAAEMEGQEDVVLAAEYLRFAAECLARITGRGEAGDVEEVLGVVFER